MNSLTGVKSLSKIVVHKEDCYEAQAGELHVVAKEMDALVEEIFILMQKHKIPFYNVEAHKNECLGTSFPMEELEHRLFILEH